MKSWINSVQGDDRLVVYSDDTIYIGNAKLADPDKAVFEMEKLNSIPPEISGFPVRYISEINMREGKKQIDLVFAKDSYEDIKISEDRLRNEVFDHFRHNIPQASYSLVKYTRLQSGKKPLIALGILLCFFIWVLYIAIRMESGIAYDVTGQKYYSIAGIVLMLASMGVIKVLLFFGSILAITLFTLVKKLKNPPVIHKLQMRRISKA